MKMKSKYLFALAITAMFLTVSVAPVLAYSPAGYKVTVIVWNRDTHRPLTGEAVYLTQGTTCTGKAPHLICTGTAQSFVACPILCDVPGPDKYGKVTFSLATQTTFGVWSSSLPLTVWVYDVANSHYNVYGPYPLLRFIPTIIFVNFSTSD
jgi:hypothetical protein